MSEKLVILVAYADKMIVRDRKLLTGTKLKKAVSTKNPSLRKD